MNKLLLMLICMFILTSCSNDEDDDSSQYSFGSLTVDNFPIGWYGMPDPNYPNGSRYYGIDFGIEGSNQKLYADVWYGLDHKANPNFNDISINKNIITAENNMFILKFRFDEHPDRYQVTFIWGEVKPEYEYKYRVHLRPEEDKYYKIK